MTSASGLMLPCAYPRVLNRITPKTAKATLAADKGTAFHAAVEAWAASGEIPEQPDMEVQGWLDLLAAQWSPPAGALFEVALGLGPGGNHVAVDEPSPHVYVASDPAVRLLTAGRADVIWLDGNIAHCRDWKTGRWPATQVEQNLQLSALALAAAKLYGAEGFVREIYYARDGYLQADLEPVMLDSIEAGEAWGRVEAAAKLDETPRPGNWCGRCWEKRTRRCSHAQAD